MKAFFYIPSLWAGGAEKQCALIAAGLKRLHGVDATIILDYDRITESNRRVVETSGVRVMVLPRQRGRAFCRLYRILSGGKSAVMFCYLTRPNLIGSLAGRLAGLSRIYSGIRCGWLPCGKLFSEVIVNRFLATQAIFNSHRAMRDFSRRWFCKRKCRVISNAIDPWADMSSRSPADGMRIVTVGRFTPEKDYRTWLETIRAAIDKGINAEAHVVGWGREEENVKRWIGELRLESHVTLHPGDSDVKELLYSSDLYLSTSTSEGVSNSIMEAMNAALPVVATDVGDNDYLIQDGGSGFICPVRDVGALSDAVVKLCNSALLRKSMGERAKERLLAHHTVDYIVSQYKELLEC